MSSEKLSLELIYGSTTIREYLGQFGIHWDCWNIYDDYSDSISKQKVTLSGKKSLNNI